MARLEDILGHLQGEPRSITSWAFSVYRKLLFDRAICRPYVTDDVYVHD